MALKMYFDERLAIVRAARELVLARHLWSRRATEFAHEIRLALDARSSPPHRGGRGQL